MADKRIAPASGSTYNGDTYYYQEVVVFTANGTILEGSPVMYDSSAAGKVIAHAGAVEHQVVGVALEAAAAGDAVEVCVKGVCLALTHGGTDTVVGDALDVNGARFDAGSTYADGDRFIAFEVYTSADTALRKIGILY